MINAIEVYDEVNDLAKKSGREGYFSKTDFNNWTTSVENLLMNYYADTFKDNVNVIESLRPFLVELPFTVASGILTLPANYRRFVDLSFTRAVNSSECGQNPTSTTVSCDYIDADEWKEMLRSPIRKPDFTKGKCRYRIINANIEVSEKTGTATLTYIRNPVYANLAFFINTVTEEEEYQAVATKNFEWLNKDRNKIVDLFCMKLGLSIRDRDLMSWLQINNQLEQIPK